MKFRKFYQNKLWRDKTVDRLEEQGSKIHWTRLENDEFIQQLKIKLLEEAQEACDAPTKELFLEELADIIEVIVAFCDLHHLMLQDILKLQNKKFLERGGFEGRKYVTVAEHPEGSFGEEYCLANPEKYPEILS